MKLILTENLIDNKKLLLQRFNDSSDIKLREFRLTDGSRALMIFLEGVVDRAAQRTLLETLLTTEIPKNMQFFDFLVEKAAIAPGCAKKSDGDEIVKSILGGDSALLIDGESGAVTFDSAQWASRSIAEPPTNTIISGPREGFTEDLRQNITQIRRRMQTPELVVDRLCIGRYTNTDVALIYVNNIADPKIIAKIKDRLSNIDIDGVLDVYYLQQYLEERNGSVFRQAGSAEKPDIVCGKILEGRVAIMINGSPMAITLPYIFFEELQQSEDYYTRTAYAQFLRLLRILAIFVGVFFPGIYVAVQIYHTQAVPQEYLFTLMSAVQGLPLKPLLEILLVLLLFEIIHESSFRMPRYVGMAMSIVGALVLGDTAVKAGLLSSPAIMITALSAVSLYTVPGEVGTFKLFRIIFTAIAGLCGFFGIILGCIILILYLAGLDSYGSPYLAPFAPLIKDDLKDAFGIKTIEKRAMRPRSIKNINQIRVKK